EAGRENGSVGVLGIRPGRQPSHAVELLQKRANELGSVVLRGELFELVDDSGEGGFDVRNCAFRVIGSLALQTALMFEVLFSLKLCDRVLRADRPRIVNEAWHAGPRDELSVDETSVIAPQKRCQDCVIVTGSRPPPGRRDSRPPCRQGPGGRIARPAETAPTKC